MSSPVIRSAPRGINARLLEMEAPFMALLRDIFSGPSGYNEDVPTLPFGPEREMDLPSNMSLRPDPASPEAQFGRGSNTPILGSGGGGNPLSMLADLLTPKGFNEEMPRLAQTPPTDSRPLQRATSIGPTPGSPEYGQQPINPALTGATAPPPTANAGSMFDLPPEVMSMVDSYLKQSGGSSAPQSAPARMASGPSRPPLGAQSRPAGPSMSPRVMQAAMGQNPEPFIPEPYDGPTDDADLSGLMRTGNNFTELMPEMITAGGGGEEDEFDEDIYDDPRTDAYLAHLERRPRHEDYKGSKARGVISGILKGLLGGDFGVGDAPHQKALRSWRDEGSGLKEGSDIEQKDLIQRRLRMSDFLKNRREHKKYELSVEKELRRHREFVARLEFMKDDSEKKRLIEADRADTLRRLAEHKERWELGKLAVQQGNLEQNRRRTDAYVANAGGMGRNNRPLPAREQEEITRRAHRMVALDPRFAKWYNPKVGGFTHRYKLRPDGSPITTDKRGNPVEPIEKMDEATQKMIQEAVAKAEAAVAKRTRSSYNGTPFSFDTLMEDDEEEDDLGLQ